MMLRSDHFFVRRFLDSMHGLKSELRLPSGLTAYLTNNLTNSNTNMGSSDPVIP